MKLAKIAGKTVNVERILYYNYDEDDETGKVTCHFVFDRDIILTEYYADFEMFELCLENYGLKEVKTLKLILNVILTLLNQKCSKFNKLKKRTERMLKRIK